MFSSKFNDFQLNSNPKILISPKKNTKNLITFERICFGFGRLVPALKKSVSIGLFFAFLDVIINNCNISRIFALGATFEVVKI